MTEKGDGSPSHPLSAILYPPTSILVLFTLHMPKPSDYTPARRRLMQGVMLLILGASIAVAAAVTTRAKRVNRVELSPEAIVAKAVSVRLPQGWRPRSGSMDPAVVVQAIEDPPPDSEIDDDEANPAAASRMVTVRLERMPSPMSSLQYLFANHELPISSPRQRHVPENWLMPTPVGGHSGVMMTAERGSRKRGSTLRKEVIAAVVLPSQRAITVHLEGVGEADAHDQAIVKQIAAAITLANEPELGKPGEIVTLVDGIRFTAPRRFAPVPQADPNVTDRLLWPAGTSGKMRDDFNDPWRAIETVGVLCPDFDPADAKQAERAKTTLATLLLVRETLWRGATITSLGNKVWRADPPPRRDSDGSSRNRAFPARAFLKTDPSGRALLTTVHCGFDEADFDGPWKEIEPTIQFLPAADIAGLEDVGTSEAARLRRAGYEKLLADRDVEWWLWSSHDAYIGWSNIDFPGAGLAGKSQAHFRLAHGDLVGHIVNNFSYQDGGPPQYTSTITRDQIGPDSSIKTIQQTTLKGGQLSMSFQHGDRAAAVQSWNGDPTPPQFVPGALLPLLLGQLSRDPMLLVTDTFPGREGLGPPQPLTVIIRPGDNMTRTAQGESTPLRCVTVQVNGAGAISRWYFRKTGELESVEGAGGAKQIASDQNVVKNNFPKESGLAP